MMCNNPVIRAEVDETDVLRAFPRRPSAGPVSADRRPLRHRRSRCCVPLVLFFSHGGWLTARRRDRDGVFHLGILTAIPMGVPLEWNVFMIFGVLALFVAHADLGLADLNKPCPSRPVRRHRGTSSSETCSRARCRSCRACATTRATGTPRCGASSRRPTRRSRRRSRRDREHPAGAVREALRQQGERPDPAVPGLCVPRDEHSRPRLVHAGAPGHGRAATRTTTPQRRRADLRTPSDGTSATATCTTSS